MPRTGSASKFGFALLFGLSLLNGETSATQAQQPENKIAAAETPSRNARPVLLELFTSEGCSSCPPADLFIKKLDAAQPVAGAQLIVLSEHVTYWDHDGWKDPNSSALLTDRQGSYESTLGGTLATPQIIVDGTEQLRLQQPPQQIRDFLQKAAAAPKVAVRIGELTLDPANPTLLRARIEADANSDKHNADIYVAIAFDHVDSQVLHGENGGKHLVHIAVVQDLIKVGKLPKGKTFAQDVQLKLKPGRDPKNLRLVAFVQESGPGRVLGAALRKPAI
jgi:hypothetical protein